MALIKCYECGAEISKSAKVCPQCGAKRKSKIVQFGKWFYGLLFLSIIFVSTISRDQEAQRLANLSPEQRAVQEKATEEKSAVYACRNFVRKYLKDPDSAEFIDIASETPVVREKDKAFKVAVAARAKNSFGAKIPSTFVCRTQHTSKDNWLLVGMEEVPM